MNKLILIFFIFLFLNIAQWVYSEDQSHREKAEELLFLMDVQKNVEKNFEVIKQLQINQLKSIHFPELDLAELKRLQEELLKRISGELNWDKLKEDYIDFFMKTFTKEEIKGIIDFYKSSIGKRFVEKTPELMNQTMDITQGYIQEIMPKIQEMTREFIQKQKGLNQ